MPEHTREILFPDSGSREEMEDLLEFYDPSSLRLRSEISPGVGEEYSKLVRGEIDEASKFIQERLVLMNFDERLDYIFQVTNRIHEARHFHDCFGTTSGFNRLVKTIEDAIEFNRTWDELRQRGRINLPLAKWGRFEDAPKILKSYLSKRRSYIEWVNLFDGSFPAVKFDGRSDADEGMLVFSLTGIETAIPAVPQNFVHAATGETFHKLMPLGARAIMEGTAFVIQRVATQLLFGERYWADLKRVLMEGPASDDAWMHYMTVDIYLSKHLGKFYEKYQLALSDISMMCSDTTDFTDEHPGWRLSKAISAAKRIGPLYEDAEGDLSVYVKKIATEAGLKSIDEVTEEAITRMKSSLAKLDKLPEAKTLWPRIVRAVSSLHLDFLELRRRFPNLMTEPAEYLGSLGALPPPPIFQEGSWLLFRGINDEDAAAFRLWFLFEHFQRQLLFSTKLPCPGSNVPHNCPGDPLTKEDWMANKKCPFSQLVLQLGLPEVTVERV